MPAGPWSARLDPHSGFVHRTATANLTFPEATIAGTSIDLTGTSTPTLLVITLLATAALMLVAVRRFRTPRQG